jgi:hypothetical protein
MKNAIRLLFLLILILALAGCRKPAPNAAAPQVEPTLFEPATALTPSPIPPPALTGDVQIQQLMLTSHTRWSRLIARGTVTLFPAPGITADPQVDAFQIWIELPAKAKVIVGPPEQTPTHTFASDGASSRWDGEPAQPLPGGLDQPFNPPAVLSDTVYQHPLGGLLGTPAADLIFPAGLAQRGGEYRVTGQENLQGRDTYVVEWGRDPGELIDRLWVDTQTGVILRQQNYGKDNREVPASEMRMLFIQFDPEIPAENFDLNSADLARLAGPEPTLDPAVPQLRIKADLDLVNLRSGPGTDYEIVRTMAPKEAAKVIGKSESGEWYKVEVAGVTGWVFFELVDLSGDPASIPVVSE